MLQLLETFTVLLVICLRVETKNVGLCPYDYHPINTCCYHIPTNKSMKLNWCDAWTYCDALRLDSSLPYYESGCTSDILNFLSVSLSKHEDHNNVSVWLSDMSTPRNVNCLQKSCPSLHLNGTVSMISCYEERLTMCELATSNHSVRPMSHSTGQSDTCPLNTYHSLEMECGSDLCLDVGPLRDIAMSECEGKKACDVSSVLQYLHDLFGSFADKFTFRATCIGDLNFICPYGDTDPMPTIPSHDLICFKFFGLPQTFDDVVRICHSLMGNSVNWNSVYANVKKTLYDILIRSEGRGPSISSVWMTNDEISAFSCLNVSVLTKPPYFVPVYTTEDQNCETPMPFFCEYPAIAVKAPTSTTQTTEKTTSDFESTTSGVTTFSELTTAATSSLFSTTLTPSTKAAVTTLHPTPNDIIEEINNLTAQCSVQTSKVDSSLCCLNGLVLITSLENNFLITNDTVDIVLDTLEQSVSELSGANRSVVELGAEDAVKIVDNLFALNINDSNWVSLTADAIQLYVNRIFVILDTVGLCLANLMETNETVPLNQTNLEFTVMRFSKRDSVQFGPSSNFNFSSSIVVSGLTTLTDVAMAVFVNYGRSVSDIYNTKADYFGDVIGSEVVTLNVTPTFGILTSPRVTINLRSLYTFKGGECVFIQNASIAKIYNSSGCVLTDANDTHVTCSCNHQTPFAVLFNGLYGYNVDSSTEYALSIITIIGTCISCACLGACIIVFTVVKPLRSCRTTIHLNLCICLLSATILFAVAIDQAQKIRDNLQMPVLCKMIAAGLHYLFLAAFFWMFVEGLHIYILVTKVFHSISSVPWFYYSIGYGCPVLIVGVTLAIHYEDYGTNTLCWLSSRDGVVWSFAGPVLVVVIINLFVLIKTLLISVSVQGMNSKSNVVKTRHFIRGSLVLMPLLGITWITAFFGFQQELNKVFAYIFTTLNSFQGFFIFVFHVLTSDQVRQNIKLSTQRWKSTRNIHDGRKLQPLRRRNTSETVTQRLNLSSSSGSSFSHETHRNVWTTTTT